MAADMTSSLSRGDLFITDGGLETTLIFGHGLDLPCFAAFPLATTAAGRATLHDYFAPYVAIARRHRVGLLVDTPTWRANPDWGMQLGFDRDALAGANRAGAELAREIQAAAGDDVPVLVSGAIGPRGDGYVAAELMSAAEAQAYHAAQVQALAEGSVDVLSAVTLTYSDEAIGVVRAAADAGLPVSISFTVETDGRLPSGEALGEAIERVDEATAGEAAYFMVNCAHPSHFADVLQDAGAWRDRLRGIRANASTLSHAELDEADDLDDGDPLELAAHYRALRAALPHLNVVGGCCGTDARHVEAICAALRD